MRVQNIQPSPRTTEAGADQDDDQAESLWERIHAAKAMFRNGLENNEPEEVTGALLELDQIIWQGHEEMESEEFISQAREIFRDHIVLLGTTLASVPKSETDCLMPVVEEMLELRQRFRDNKQWSEADAIRDSLLRSQIVIDDTPDGARWHLKS